jgi:hypothetical protein
MSKIAENCDHNIDPRARHDSVPVANPTTFALTIRNNAIVVID